MKQLSQAKAETRNLYDVKATSLYFAFSCTITSAQVSSNLTQVFF